MCIVLSSFIFFRATALAILSAKDGLKALKTSLTPQPLLSDRKLSPLQLLIKEMPGENLHSFPCQYSIQLIVIILVHVMQHQSAHVILIE